MGIKNLCVCLEKKLIVFDKRKNKATIAMCFSTSSPSSSFFAMKIIVKALKERFS